MSALTRKRVCLAADSIGGLCAGVPAEPICSQETCTDGVACARIVVVHDDAELRAASSSAGSGTCIALAPGAYEAASLPGGVSLLGQAASLVTIAGVTLGAGAGAVVRGISVDAAGIQLAGATGARIEAVRVAASDRDGIALTDGSSASIDASEIIGATRYGLSAFDSGALSVEATIVSDANGAGVWVQCKGGCDCATPPKLHVASSILRDNRLVGLDVTGVSADLDTVSIARSRADSGFKGGFGAVVTGCSDVTARQLTVRDSAGIAVLVDGASARIGVADESEGVRISGNGEGVWLQNVDERVGQSASLSGFVIEDNAVIGVGISGQSRVMLRGGSICRTIARAVPASKTGTGAIMVGDAIDWIEYSSVDIDGLSLCDSGRASLLIDGLAAPNSRLSHVTLSGGDEDKGIVQQRLPPGFEGSPEIGPGVPALVRTAGQPYPLPW